MSLNLPKFTEDMNKISSLDDEPAMTSSQLKAKFDEGGNAVKTYLNETLIPQAETQIATEMGDIATAKCSEAVGTAKTYTDTEITSLVNGTIANMSTSINSLSSTVNSLSSTVSGLNTSNSKKTVYGDFVTTEISQNYSLSQSSNKTLTFQHSKSGYYPLAIASVKLTTWYEVDTMTPAYFETATTGSATVKMVVAHGNTAASISGTAYTRVLWVKVR